MPRPLVTPGEFLIQCRRARKLSRTVIAQRMRAAENWVLQMETEQKGYNYRLTGSMEDVALAYELTVDEKKQLGEIYGFFHRLQTINHIEAFCGLLRLSPDGRELVLSAVRLWEGG